MATSFLSLKKNNKAPTSILGDDEEANQGLKYS